jgi:hypothetical protein
MAKRGRKSAADAVRPDEGTAKAPPPPRDLSPEERTIWREVIADKPAAWLTADAVELMRLYVKHAARGRQIDVAMREHLTGEHLHCEEGQKLWAGMARERERETRALLACARALRLTPQARMDPKVAATKSRRAAEAAAKAPWES